MEEAPPAMSDPLRILCLNYEYPPVGGGGGRIAHRINAELVRRGHAVRVLTAGMSHLPPSETVDGVEIFRAGKFRKKEDTCTVPEMAHYLLAGFLPAMALIRKWKPHVIHAHFAVPTGALAYKVSLLTGIPYVVTAHLGDVPGGVPDETGGLFRVVQPFTRPIWKRAKALTAVSTFVANLAERAYKRRPEVILNGVTPIPAPRIEIHQPPKILFVGRLGPQKNPLLAIRALELVKDLPWRLEVIGDGPLASDMKAAATSLGDRVDFRGWRSGAEVATAMNSSDILLMTSVSEGMPMVAVEAIQHGLALVVSRVDGMADVAHENENALLAKLTAEAFAERLRALLTQPEWLLRLRQGSAAMAGDFDLSRSVDTYERVLSAAARR
jgi:glycosyltransferase involved in cell wall biosynthesis